MKRSLAAAALAGVIGLVPLAGHAQAAHGLSCTLGGTINYTDTDGNPVSVGGVVTTVSAEASGTVLCYHGSADAAASAVNGDQLGGTYDSVLQGGASCTLNSMAGTINMTFPGADGTTRDVYTGTDSYAGPLASVLNVHFNTIQHQSTPDSGVTWNTDSQETVQVNVLVGHFLQQPDDPTQCTAPVNPDPMVTGFSSASVQGHFAGTLVTDVLP